MRIHSPSFLLLFVGFLCNCFAAITQVPYDPSPFTTTGYITGATINNQSDILSGGTITLNGNIEIVIPRNLLVNTPSLTAVAWSEMFTSNGDINLPLWPEVSWEAFIYANYIGGRHVAGIVYILQEIGNLNEGFITSIDYEKGEMRINGDFNDPTSGIRLVINDPVGRYGMVHGDWPLWTADTDNPSITASTGYPVCLPRVDPATGDDPLCPKKNRPLDTNGNPLTIFTFPAPPVPEGQPDPNLFAPLMVGDFIVYSATLVEDQNGDRLLAAYSINVNLGFYTAPGTIPAYLIIVEPQVGINGDPRGEIEETRVEGFTTDQTATILVSTIDKDPCTGEEKDRSWGSAIPRAAAVQGNYRFRSDDVASLAPFTREVVVQIARGTVDTPNGITAGRFVSPQPPDGWLFPELLVFGDDEIPSQFDLLPFLAAGSGPWLGGIPGVPQTATGPIVGQLDPWPGVAVVTPRNCPAVDPSIPVAQAGEDLTVASNGLVTLIGTNTKEGLSSDNLTFTWTQLSGPTVSLNSTGNGTVTFVAPAVSSITNLIFQLTVANSAGNSTDTVMVNIVPVVIDHITLDLVSWKSGKGSGTLTVIATTDVASAMLFVSATNPDVATIAMTSLGAGRFQALVSMRPAPASVTVTSNLGGFAATSTIAHG
ncbi:hypothetical protein D9758_009603 [Tetrapyrgos nigripes]|uniref:Uncharacterized protein n=1 Tax=Tetrapyrgos nigripes TaxID=182062 RepID=A0A8H5GD52_9AGAR|nr:hypothetical protein D9758_009603 [Tetrapyrgos nigripes]